MESIKVMEHSPIKYEDEDVEDGEISDSDDAYTPLQRPMNAINHIQIAGSDSLMDGSSDHDDSLHERTSDSSDSESGFRMNKKPSPKKLHLRPIHKMIAPSNRNSTASNKFNVWTASLQDSVIENLKGCGVDQDSGTYDRHVESYDYSLKYRLNGENTLKRRQSASEDSESQNYACGAFGGGAVSKSKRFRSDSLNANDRKNVRLRLGGRSDDSSSNEGSTNTTAMKSPRCILDLQIRDESTNDDIARDIANKLYEEKDDLMIRVLNTLGRKIPIEMFKETQRIESEGGMLIMNGMRRRTPGGVFLFLLKQHNDIRNDQKKQIFIEENRKTARDRKAIQAMKRDRKVEELKKTLTMEELPALLTRKELLSSSPGTSHLKPETHANLSNPPPSPVTDCNRENSSDFDTHTHHHVNVTSPEKEEVFPKLITAPATYTDDFLDMNCDDMDLF